MNEIPKFLVDPGFWTSLMVFAASIVGVILILKQLQKHNDDEPEPEDDGTLATIPLTQSAAVETLPPPIPAGATQKIQAQQQVRAAEKADTIDPSVIYDLESKIAEIHDTLNRLESKIDHLAEGGGKNEMTTELKSVVRALKTNAAAGDSEQIAILSLKLDKIYKVLTSLSGSE